jgi:hypothetical protein
VSRFGRGVLRVGIDDDQARTQRAENTDHILQQIRQLNRQPVTGLQARLMAQITRQGVGLIAQTGEAERVGSAGEGRFVAIVTAGLLENVVDGGMAELGQLRRDGGVCGGRHRNLVYGLLFCTAK